MVETARERVPEKPGILFMGTPEFAIPPFDALIKEDHRILAAVTQPDRPKGRGRKPSESPVKRLARSNGIAILQPEKVSDTGFCRLIRGMAPDLIIVVAFGQILTRDLLTIPSWGVINIHASLLPAYRGAAPIQRVILNNESVTGLTVMNMDEGLDTGPILFQEKVTILKDETSGQLHDRLASLAGDLIVRTLDRMIENPVAVTYQDHSRAIYAHKITRGMARIDWTRDAVMVSAHIRALDPRPGAVSTINGRDVKLFSSRVWDESRKDVVPGRVIRRPEGGFCVEAGKGVVEIREIQYPGRRRIASSDFLRGFSLAEGTILGT